MLSIEKKKTILRVIQDQHPICQKCVPSVYDKYAELSRSGQNPFQINCQYIPELEDSIPKVLLSGLTDDEREEAASLYDVVLWCKRNLIDKEGGPYIPRWYQEELLKCTAKKKIFRTGRRVGKTDSLCIKILHKMSTKRKCEVLVFTPQVGHAEEIFDRLLQFIKDSPNLRSSYESSKKTPHHEIKFTNGSRMRGYCSGDNSNSAGLSVRGKDADLIVLDEAAYIAEETIKGAVTPIFMTSPNVEFIASSTPTGKRDLFYKWSQEDPSYKEFHFPSSVIPFWDKLKDEILPEYKDNPDAYAREVEALHGASEDGVYKTEDVRKAQRDFTYDDAKPEDNYIYSIGVDWNKSSGTEIAIVGYNSLITMYKVALCVNISRGEFTQSNALQRIIDLVNIWKPFAVYPDEGYGSTSIEMLKLAGILSTPDQGYQSRLYEILKPYNFSSKVEIKDPASGLLVKKDSKPFMVENSVRRFEENNIEISSHDYLLIKQLGNYIIKSRSQNGRPIYSAVDKKVGDHRLDAVNLALVAFKLELSDFSPQNHSLKGMKPRLLDTVDCPVLLRGTERDSIWNRLIPRLNLGVDISSITGKEVEDFRPNFFSEDADETPVQRKTSSTLRVSFLKDFGRTGGKNSGGSRFSVPSRRV